MAKGDKVTIFRPPVYFASGKTPTFIDRSFSPLNWLLWHRIKLQEMNRESKAVNIYDIPRGRRSQQRHNSVAQSGRMAFDEVVRETRAWARNSAHVPSARFTAHRH